MTQQLIPFKSGEPRRGEGAPFTTERISGRDVRAASDALTRTNPVTASTQNDSEFACARAIAAEDLRPGDWITVLTEMQEEPAWLYGCDVVSQRPIVRAQYLHSAGTPLRVQAICLPFVLASTANRAARVLDVRLCEFGRLSKHYVRQWKRVHRTT